MQNNKNNNEIEELLQLYDSKNSVERLIPWIHLSIAEGDLDATLFYGYYLIKENIDKELGELMLKVVSMSNVHRLTVYLIYISHCLMMDKIDRALKES